MEAKNPPKHLSGESKKVWRSISNEWTLEANHLPLLKTALEAYDRMNDAREKIDRIGIIIKTPTGFAKENPLLKVEKDARSGFLQAWKLLNLDIETPGDIGRPPKT